MNSGTLALLVAVSCWGLAVPLSKGLLRDLDPGLLICVQLAASVLVLVGVALARRTRLLPARARLLPILLIGTLEPGLAYYLEFLGLQHTTALHAALILTLEPVGILILNVLIFRFRRDLQLLLAAAGASLGVLIVVLGSPAEGGAASLYGDTIVVAGTLAASLYVSLSTQLLSSESLPSLLLWQQLASLAFVVGACGLSTMPGGWSQAPKTSALLGAAAVGVLQFALAFLFYFHGTRKSPGYWGVVVLNLAPVVGIAASVLILREAPEPLYFVGAALCLGASLYTRLREHALERQPLTESP
jgi:drug/metabolite transporter (DMT)-like permease